MTYDPASLEGGLLVEGFIEDLRRKRFKPTELVELIERLYQPSALKRCRTTFCKPGDVAEWYYNAVCQIRTLSWSAEHEAGQYALTLALCLLRKGCNTHSSLDADEPNTMRAIAFLFGQRILRAIASKVGSSTDR